MRLLDDEANHPVDRVWIYLTEAEARDLSEQLATLFADDQPASPWHGHVVSEDGRPKELTVALYDPTADTRNPGWREWFAEDRWAPEMFRSRGSLNSG